MPGPQPKPAARRSRPGRKTATAATLTAQTGSSMAPELPPLDWHPMTVVWWQELWASPMAPEYDESDRHGLFKLAMLHNDFWTATSPTARIDVAKEIRLQEQRFGLSPLDRRRLQWEIERGAEAEERGRRRRTAPTPEKTAKGRKKPADPRLTLVSDSA